MSPLSGLQPVASADAFPPRRMFAGRFFFSSDPGLDPCVQQLDARVAALFPELSNGVAEARLRLREDRSPGRCLALADGFRLARVTPSVPHFGRVVPAGAPDGYVLASLRKNGRSWHPPVDAGALCRAPAPDLCNAALCNHTCHGATVVPCACLGALPCPLGRWFRPADA